VALPPHRLPVDVPRVSSERLGGRPGRMQAARSPPLDGLSAPNQSDLVEPPHLERIGGLTTPR